MRLVSCQLKMNSCQDEFWPVNEGVYAPLTMNLPKFKVRTLNLSSLFPMPQSQLPLSKMTKAELSEEYRKLLEKYDELKMTARIVGEPKNAELLERVREYTAEHLTAALAALKTEFGTTVDEFSGRLLAEAKKLGDMQQAMELSKKNLELHYHIQVAAETLEQLVAEHETKQLALTKETEVKRQSLADEMEKAHRDWQRELEEYEYRTKVQRERAAETDTLARAKKESELATRIEQLRQQEAEVQQLRQQVAAVPAQLDKALALREQEVTKRLRAQADAELAAMKKDWAAAKNILELKISTQHDQLKQQSVEIAALRQDAERANRKAQELAVKVIESGRGIAPMAAGEKSQPAPSAEQPPLA